LLLWHAWLDPDCSLPNDDKRLAFLARCTPAEWRRIKPTVMPYFYVSERALIRQKRLDKTKAEVAARSKKAHSAATAKWLIYHERRAAQADAYASAEHVPKVAPSTGPSKAGAMLSKSKLKDSESESSPKVTAGAEGGPSPDGGRPDSIPVNPRKMP
jgi:uncharacterized protein YdaU (DUF1376 family)